MASTDAKHIPVKNAAYRITFPIFDADGDLVTGATGLDSEVSIDGGTFADCTNEATEIATSSGMYYLDLTASEMNGDTIAVIIKTSSSGAKTTPIVLYTAARSVNDLAYPTVSGRSLDVSAGGEAGVDWANVGSPTTTLNLSGTIVKTATDVEADTQDIQGRLPAALTGSGSIKAALQNEAHGGSAAVLTLERLVATSTTSNQAAVKLTGNGSAAGLELLGGSTGPGMTGTAGAFANTGGAILTGKGSGPGLGLLAGPTGHGLLALGGSSSGDGVRAENVGTGYDINASLQGSVSGTVGGIAGTLQTIDALWAKIKKYFQLLLRKDAAIATDNATELTEINASGGSGAGAFANTTDSVEAIRDRGDAAWVTGTSLDAAGVRSAVGLASANLDAQLNTIDDFLDTEVAAIKAKTDNLPPDPADASDIATLFAALNNLSQADIRTALGLASANLDAQLAALNTALGVVDGIVDAILVDTTELADTVLADSVPADGTLGTLKQTLYEIRQFLFEATVSGTTVTSKKADGSSTLETFQTNDASAPTSITRSG